MNKKGFTLVELLAVIAILAIVITIGLISVTRIRENALKKIVATKIEQIEQAAILYGQENPEELTSDNDNCKGVITTENKAGDKTEYNITICTIKTAGELINAGFFDSKYLNKENGKVDLINDYTGKSMLNDTVIIYRRNNRIYSIIDDVKSNAGV
ncbi:MAG: type II secretion system protein [Bacilli bacterium]